ncbi:PREDICTED: F-box only protein 36 [Chrysochloris asiatica]|uniref:F-box only protein 36 n=1 Tax=Chrysochloris asiatica TaxID=185453 RepID=A0A9B0TSC5_CHRAS|nr:PREDICTED: F-box only protein 36 [Chrysochloris asiatica]
MASWLPDTLFEIVGQGPAPSKDYYQLLVTRSQIIFRWWKISLRSEYRTAKPGEVKESHVDFLENSHLQVQVALIFGAKIIEYVLNLCQGKFDFLERLSDSLLLCIISYLDLEDIARLSQTSRKFAKLCMCDTLWEQIVQSACDTITPDMRALAEDIGWKEMFFTNRLQLQLQLHRRKQKLTSHRGAEPALGTRPPAHRPAGAVEARQAQLLSASLP